MKRRAFITLIGGAAVAWPFTARGQQPVTPVIGFLITTKPYPALINEFRNGLAENGFYEGRMYLSNICGPKDNMTDSLP